MKTEAVVMLALCALAISALPNQIVPEQDFNEEAAPAQELAQLRQAVSQLSAKINKIATNRNRKASPQTVNKKEALLEAGAYCEDDSNDSNSCGYMCRINPANNRPQCENDNSCNYWIEHCARSCYDTWKFKTEETDQESGTSTDTSEAAWGTKNNCDFVAAAADPAKESIDALSTVYEQATKDAENAAETLKAKKAALDTAEKALDTAQTDLDTAQTEHTNASTDSEKSTKAAAEAKKKYRTAVKQFHDAQIAAYEAAFADHQTKTEAKAAAKSSVEATTTAVANAETAAATASENYDASEKALDVSIQKVIDSAELSFDAHQDECNPNKEKKFTARFPDCIFDNLKADKANKANCEDPCFSKDLFGFGIQIEGGTNCLSSKDGDEVGMWECNEASARQQWHLSETKQLTNSDSNRCLTVSLKPGKTDYTADGNAETVMKECVDGDTPLSQLQQWSFPENTKYLKNVKSGLCLDAGASGDRNAITNDDTGEGGGVHMWSCFDWNPNVRWEQQDWD